MKKKILVKNNQSGFTLVEMMVAVGIFVIVAFIVTSTFLTLAEANRKAQNIRLVMDNLNFAIDSMALKMREGNTYTCDDGGNSCDSFQFSRSDGRYAAYKFISGTPGQIVSCEGATPCEPSVPVTAPQIDVKNFSVLISASNPKSALLRIEGTAGSGKTLSSFNIQTTVTERN